MKKVKEVIVPYVPRRVLLEEKAEVETKPVRFPKELGEEHPFNFKEMELAYAKIGMIKTINDKHLDFIVSPGFYIRCKDTKVETLINNFIRNSGFESTLRSWILEGLNKGNGFLEVSSDKKSLNLKVVNANNMYIVRDKRGKILGYNQYVGEFDKFNPKKIISFTENEITHLPLNIIGDDAYGFGITLPVLMTVNNMIKADKDMHTMNSRKANSPYIAYVGTPEFPPTQADIDDQGAKFEHLNNVHEWAVPYTTKIEKLDFGNIGEKFASVLESDFNQLVYISQIPAVLWGMANVNEGIAKVQEEAWERRISSLQAAIEKVVEEKIFGRILEMNGFDITNPNLRVEFEWGQPSEVKINERITQLTMLLNNAMLSPQLRAAIELDIAEQLGYEDAMDVLIPPEEAPTIEQKREQDLKQPEVPGEKQRANVQLTEFIRKKGNEYCVYSHQTGKNFGCYPTRAEAEKRLGQMHAHKESVDMKLNEWLNFDYRAYEREVLEFISRDNFSLLAGKNSRDFALGLLTKSQIIKLKAVLYDGFENNLSVREISDNISTIGLKDRYTINSNGDKVLQFSKEERPIVIARSESTRVASEGVLNHYQNQGIEKVTFVASISDRTCPECLGLNGQVFELNESRGVIPVHTMCRCTWVGIA